MRTVQMVLGTLMLMTSLTATAIAQDEGTPDASDTPDCGRLWTEIIIHQNLTALYYFVDVDCVQWLANTVIDYTQEQARWVIEEVCRIVCDPV